jgi:hypothetical protein
MRVLRFFTLSFVKKYQHNPAHIFLKNPLMTTIDEQKSVSTLHNLTNPFSLPTWRCISTLGAKCEKAALPPCPAFISQYNRFVVRNNEASNHPPRCVVLVAGRDDERPEPELPENDHPRWWIANDGNAGGGLDWGLQ